MRLCLIWYSSQSSGLFKMEVLWSFEMLGTNYPAMSQKKRRLQDITLHIKEKLHGASISLKTALQYTRHVSMFQDMKVLRPKPFKWSFLRFSRILINSGKVFFHVDVLCRTKYIVHWVMKSNIVEYSTQTWGLGSKTDGGHYSREFNNNKRIIYIRELKCE